MQGQLEPVEDSTWPLWLALIISLIIFIVLLAHLACKPGMVWLLSRKLQLLFGGTLGVWILFETQELVAISATCLCRLQWVGP